MNSIYQVLSPFFKLSKPGFVLFGHGVSSEKAKDPIIQSLHIEFENFARMIEIFEKVGFQFISMDDVAEVVLHKRKIDRPWIHLTFDDGYKNNFTTAYPYLKAKNIPFTIFVSTRNVFEQKRFDIYTISCSVRHTNRISELQNIITPLQLNDHLNNRDTLIPEIIQKFKYFSVQEKVQFIEKVETLLSDNEWADYNLLYDSEDLLSLDQIKMLSKDPLVYFGSHGHNHYILSTLDKQQIDFELNQSRSIITELTGKTPYAYCYPNGRSIDFPENMNELFEQNRYELAFTTAKQKYSPADYQFAIPRLPVSKKYLPMLFAKLL